MPWPMMQSVRGSPWRGRKGWKRSRPGGGGPVPPGAVEPGVPGDVAGGAAEGAIALEGVEAVVEGVVEFGFDESAADPEAAGAVVERTGVEAAGDLVVFEALFPGLAGVGDDELFADDEAIDGELFERSRGHAALRRRHPVEFLGAVGGGG